MGPGQNSSLARQSYQQAQGPHPYQEPNEGQISHPAGIVWVSIVRHSQFHDLNPYYPGIRPDKVTMQIEIRQD
jgi:hypothetical protein